MGVLEGRTRINPWPRRLRAVGLVAILVTVVGLWVGGTGRLGDGETPDGPEVAGPGPELAEAKQSRSGRRDAEARRIALSRPPGKAAVRHEFDQQPRAGVLFDVDSGEILWQHNLNREAPIASLTKMMTAHLIAKRHKPDEKVKISGEAVGVGGSMIGLLPQGEKVPLGALLKGLLLVSGNDAAVALAEHDSGSVRRFVARMNAEADRLGLDCSRFSSPHGLEDAKNFSCAADLAALARLVLSHSRLAAITASDRAQVDFPIEGGKLELFNNNPFIRAGDESVTGVKTGFTAAAGRCYVMAAERGGRHLGVVLLDSPDPLAQVPKLWKLGFEATAGK